VTEINSAELMSEAHLEAQLADAQMIGGAIQNETFISSLTRDRDHCIRESVRLRNVAQHIDTIIEQVKNCKEAENVPKRTIAGFYCPKIPSSGPTRRELRHIQRDWGC